MGLGCVLWFAFYAVFFYSWILSDVQCPASLSMTHRFQMNEKFQHLAPALWQLILEFKKEIYWLHLRALTTSKSGLKLGFM